MVQSHYSNSFLLDNFAVKLFSIIITLPRRKIHSHFVPRRITIKSKTVFQSLFCLEPHNVLKYQVTGCCLISVHFVHCRNIIMLCLSLSLVTTLDTESHLNNNYY